MSDNSTFRIKGDIVKDPTAIFDGDYVNTFIIMDGTLQQQIDGDFTGTQEIQDLEINNPQGVTIVNASNDGVDIEEDLKLVNGRVVTNDQNTLRIRNGGTISQFSQTSYIQGPLVRELSSSTSKFNFPVGESSRYGLMAIDNPSVSSARDFAVRYYNAIPETNPIIGTGNGANINPVLVPAIESVSGNEYWSITVPSPASSNVELYWDATSDVQSTISNLRIMYWDDANNYWDQLAPGVLPVGTPTEGSLSAGPLSYSTQLVTFGSIDATATPLPVELASFEGQVERSAVRLDWSTASEIDNDYFEVLRSIDGRSFEVIGTVDGSGNSSELIEYYFYDENPLGGANFYRLRQVDYDGDFEFSPIIRVEVDPGANASLTLYPNPVDDQPFNILLEGYLSDGINGVYILHGTDGRIIKQGTITSRNTELQLSGEPAGIYFIKVHIGSKYYNLRLIKR
jgi:hypothetical protein